MDNEILNVLKEIRDLQKEAIENQKKALETVKVQQKFVFKRLLILFFGLFVILAVLSLF